LGTILLWGSGTADAFGNPLVLSKADQAVLPLYLWAGAVLILLLESLSVSAWLAGRGYPFRRLGPILWLANLALFALGSRWLILVGPSEPEIGWPSLITEGGIILAETMLLYWLTRQPRISTPRSRPVGWGSALAASLIANLLSGLAGVIMSLWVYGFLYGGGEGL
jgi:hypothetical protein